MSAIAPTGLTVLYEPEGQPVDVEYDLILFVHGLQGHPERTWLYDGEPPHKSTSTSSSLKSLFRHRSRRSPSRSTLRNERNIYWPKDLLPELCPTSRIMTFGYDTVVTKGYVPADKGSIFSHARDLLYELERNRTQGRYLIFVAHSLGGIVVKEVLRRSEISSEESIRDILGCTLGVVFMGTPHRGSPDFASPADVVRRVAQTVLRMDTNPAVLRSLGLDSPELELCRESFITQWRTRDFIVKTFQESHGIVGVNVGPFNDKVVPDTSSSLDDPREHAETIPADHMNMCRFSGAEDPKWKKVGPELQRLSRVRRAFEHGCETSLAFPELSHRQEAITDPLQKTCDWVFQTDTYRSWASRTNPQTVGGFLWLKGKPGSGKSTLMKEGLKRMAYYGAGTGTRVVTAPFFFNARGSYLERSPLGMLRALCYHLLKHDDHFRMHLANHYKEKSQLNQGKWEPREDELQHLITTGFQTRRRLAMQRVVFFIDALDECEERKVRQIVHYLAHLVQDVTSMGQQLDICLSSRHYPTITAPRCVDLVVEDGNQVDIVHYIRQKVPYGVMPDPASVDALHRLLVQKASGIFLWVVLVAEIVLRDIDEGKTSWEIERTLAEVPDDLIALFSDLIRTLGSKEVFKSRALISLVLLAKQPIPARSTTTLQVFMEETIHSLDDATEGLLRLQGPSLSWDQDLERIRRMVRAMSRGLIEINRFHNLQFIHETAREFFITEGPRIFNTPRFTSIGHCMIIRTCVHALCMLQLTKPRAGNDEGLMIFDNTLHIDWFQDYVRFLPHHATQARREVVLPNQLIHSVDRVVSVISRRRIVDSPLYTKIGIAYVMEINENRLGPHILNDRHLVSCCISIALLCNRILNTLEIGQSPHELPMAGSAMSAIPPEHQHWQLRPESDGWTSLRDGTLIRSDGPKVLDSVALQTRQNQERDAMIKLHRLLSSGTPFQSSDSEGNTILHIAAWQGMPELIDIICDHGHPVDIPNNYDMTPLCLATQYGHKKAAARLLARGASPSLPGPQGCTPLHLSMETANLAMIQLLIASGASVSARDAQGRSPLHAAAKYNAPEDVVTSLINADADANARDDDLVTPIMVAVYYGRDAMHWANPRVRWSGHRTNYVKMMESRVGYRRQESSAVSGDPGADLGLLLPPWSPPPPGGSAGIYGRPASY